MKKNYKIVSILLLALLIGTFFESTKIIAISNQVLLEVGNQSFEKPTTKHDDRPEKVNAGTADLVWETTEKSEKIELWPAKYVEKETKLSVPSLNQILAIDQSVWDDKTQKDFFKENVVYQDVQLPKDVVAGDTISFSFKHAANNGLSSLRFVAGAPNEIETVNHSDDIFSEKIFDSGALIGSEFGWKTQTGEFKIPENFGKTLRIGFATTDFGDKDHDDHYEITNLIDDLIMLTTQSGEVSPETTAPKFENMTTIKDTNDLPITNESNLDIEMNLTRIADESSVESKNEGLEINQSAQFPSPTNAQVSYDDGTVEQLEVIQIKPGQFELIGMTKDAFKNAKISYNLQLTEAISEQNYSVENSYRYSANSTTDGQKQYASKSSKSIAINDASISLLPVNSRDNIVSGTGLAGSLIKLILADGTTKTTYVNGDGVFHFGLTTTEIKRGDVLNVEVATEERQAMMEIVVDGTEQPQAMATNGKTNMIQGTATPNAQVKISLPNETIAVSDVDATGKYSYKLEPENKLENGQSLQVEGLDRAGNKSKNAYKQIIGGTLQPKVKPIEENAKTITGTATPNAFLNFTFSEKEIVKQQVNSDGNFTINVPSTVNLKSGDKVSVISNDSQAAEKNSSTPFFVVVNGTVIPKVNPYRLGDPAITGIGTSGTEIKVILPKNEIISSKVKPDNHFAVPMPTNLKLGVGDEIKVIADDGAGNSSLGVKISVKEPAPTNPAVVPEIKINTSFGPISVFNGTSPIRESVREFVAEMEIEKKAKPQSLKTMPLSTTQKLVGLTESGVIITSIVGNVFLACSGIIMMLVWFYRKIFTRE
ncbi:MAG: Ig-like domain-containing protein [Mycoplasmatales bacterium]